MGRTEQIATQKELLEQLFPTGQAWSREAGGNLMKMVEGLAEEFAELDTRQTAIHEEADPRSTGEMLADWEGALGLPDDCAGNSTTLQERKAAVLTRYLNQGGQDEFYFQDLATSMGYDIEIDEFSPFMAGLSKCGDPVYVEGRPFVCGASKCGDPIFVNSHSVRFIWRVRVKGNRLTLFRTGQSQCGDPLYKISRAEDLECLFNRLKPAHSHLVFEYLEEI